MVLLSLWHIKYAEAGVGDSDRDPQDRKYQISISNIKSYQISNIKNAEAQNTMEGHAKFVAACIQHFSYSLSPLCLCVGD